MSAAPRIAFVTIGQAPRVDLTPEILDRIDAPIDAAEFGALDDLSAAEVAAMAPRPGEASLCTRMRDGSEVVIGKDRKSTRLNSVTNAHIVCRLLLEKKTNQRLSLSRSHI